MRACINDKAGRPLYSAAVAQRAGRSRILREFLRYSSIRAIDQDGDLKHHVDYQSLYTTVVKD